MKIIERTVKIVNIDELQEALILQGLPEDSYDIYDYLHCDREIFYGCYIPLDQDQPYIKNATHPGDIAYNFILSCLKDMFGTDYVLVSVPM